ncbi:MAG: TetR/AcrR family transcriptional regulator [Deltaproteobacteria bacterium]|nr:TetR/AcrR family transcriptional regulator [Deltaproteobacteria bacterium]
MPGERRTDPQEERAAKRRGDRRDQIIAAATEVFAEFGYHLASISEIIRRAGIARGTFYLYFDSKHAVFDSILSGAMVGLASRIRVIETASGSEPPHQQAEQNIRRVLQYLYENRPLSQLLLNPGLTPDTESAQHLQAFYDRVAEMIRASLDHGINIGLVRACDTELVAPALLGAIRSVTRQLLKDDATPDLDRVVGELVAFGWRGVMVPEVWD